MPTTTLPLQTHQQADTKQPAGAEAKRRRGCRRLTVKQKPDDCHVHVAALLLLIFCSPLGDAWPSHGSPANGKINGMQLLNGQWGQAKYDSTEALATLESLTNQTGANWISMTFW